MKKITKMALVLASTLTASISAYANVPAKTWARVDINAELESVRLTPVKEELTPSTYLFPAQWRKDKQAFYLSSQIFFKEDVVRSIKLVCTADKTGSAKLVFNGVYRTESQMQERGEAWFAYSNIKVNGEELPLAEEAFTLRRDAEIMTSVGSKGEEVPSIKVSAASTASYSIDVAKDQKVVIEFDVKFVGAVKQ